MSGIAFQNVAGLKPGRTRFDWHTTRKLDVEMGGLYPIFCRKCIPGDWWKIEHDILVRCIPLAAPVMHEVDIYTHYFFIPERLLDDTNSRPGCGNPKGDPLILGNTAPPSNRFNWELFITGGFDGNDTQTIPLWQPDTAFPVPPPTSEIFSDNGCGKYSLWDYFGLPVLPEGTNWTSPLKPQDSIRRAYNFIYNEYYRDETLQQPVRWSNEKILIRSWRKDYFTSALPFQQRGVAPSFPVEFNLTQLPLIRTIFDPPYTNFGESGTLSNNVSATGNAPPLTLVGASSPVVNGFNQAMTARVTQAVSDNMKADLSGGLTNTFDVADLRNIVQLQKYLERNARAGVRFNEFIMAHFGEHLRDERINRPEYIGGTKQPLIISEVLQTSESNQTPLGTMAGHGISAHGDYVGDYKCVEHGWIIGIMSILPVPAYQQGIPREMLAETKLDFFTPEFVNLSEQGIKQGELYIANNSTDEMLFGYQGMYDEYRTANSQVCGAFRDELDYWHLGRKFANAPSLNSAFIQCRPIDTRRIFLDQTVPGLLCDVEHYYTAVRPMPEIAEPGLVDHH